VQVQPLTVSDSAAVRKHVVAKDTTAVVALRPGSALTAALMLSPYSGGDMFPYSGGELPYPAGGELPYPGGDPYVGVSGVDVFRTEPPVLPVHQKRQKSAPVAMFRVFLFRVKKFLFCIGLSW
jgi:hypothetical protein